MDSREFPHECQTVCDTSKTQYSQRYSKKGPSFFLIESNAHDHILFSNTHRVHISGMITFGIDMMQIMYRCYVKYTDDLG